MRLSSKLQTYHREELVLEEWPDGGRQGEYARSYRPRDNERLHLVD